MDLETISNGIEYFVNNTDPIAVAFVAMSPLILGTFGYVILKLGNLNHRMRKANEELRNRNSNYLRGGYSI